MLHAPGIPGTPVCRPLRPSDAAGLMTLRHRALQECPHYFGTPTATELAKSAGHYRRQLLGYQRSGKALMLGCWREQQLTGIAGLKQRQWKNRIHGLIYSLYVDPGSRGQGLGKTLLHEAQQQLLDRWQIRHALVNVEVSNLKALQLYQACGFQITGIQEQAFWINGTLHDVYILESGG